MVDAGHRRLRLVLLAGVPLAALAMGWLLRLWIPSPSERFYLLVPPVAAACYLLWNWPSLDELKKLLWKTFGQLLLAGAVCWVYMAGMLYQLLPVKGPGFFQYIDGREVLVALYFLVAVVTLAAIVGGVFDSVGLVLGRRFAPNGPEGARTRPWLGFTLEQVLPRLLTVLIALPCLLSAMTVHRMRLPVVATPKLLDRGFEDIEFQAVDGTRLRGWFIPAKSPSDQTVVICHGLGANRGVFLNFLHVADALEANALFFDFRGHGASDGHTVSLGYFEKLDVLASIEYLRRERPQQSRRMIGLGISMGSAAMIRAAAEVEPPLDGLLIDSGFTSTAEMAEQVVWFLPPPARSPVVAVGVPLACLETGCQLYEVRPIDDIPRVRCPVLFCHAEGDTLIPVSHGRALYAQALDPKRIFVVPGGYHAGAFPTNPQGYFEAVTQHLGQRPD